MKKILKGAGSLLLLALLLVMGMRFMPHPPLSQGQDFSKAVYDSHGNLLRLSLAADGSFRLWTPFAEISPRLKQAVLLHEDRWFYYHPGFNPLSLLRGAFTSYGPAGRRQGGSTITMQLARMRWQLNTKDISGKLVQILRAIQLELFYSKDDILEAYFNYAPYGGNIEGVGAASLIYFNKNPASLSLPELLGLAVIPQAPSARMARQGVMGKPLQAARNRLFKRWLQENPADVDKAALMDLPLSMRPVKALPFAAPHFVDQVMGQPASSQQVLRTTLDYGLQRLLERQLSLFIEQRQNQGVNNAAAILLDWRDMSVKALVGSAGYLNSAIAGQVNGTTARRSPGSLLKPFIFGLALAQGLLHSQTLLKDVPSAFGMYAPENFDGHFMGPLSATQALVRSRNIPAVQIAAALRSPSFYGFLQQTGIEKLANENHYGLSLALGGGEITMQEVARLYAMLANRGVMRPLSFIAGERTNAWHEMLSPEACFVTLKMLEQNKRPNYSSASAASVPVYWKTGTSWGFRDAWCAGIWGPYVMVVWVGDFSGKGNQAFVGLQSAAPLFFAMHDSINASNQAPVVDLLEKPAGVSLVEVCAQSGLLPNAWCPHKTNAWFIPGVSPIKVDDIHRPVVVDTGSGRAACPPYDPRRTQVRVYEFWPTDLQQIFIQAGLMRTPPPSAENCAVGGGADGVAPQITSPRLGGSLQLRVRGEGAQALALSAVNDAKIKINYWFVDDAYLGNVAAGEVFYWQPARAGNYIIKVVDDHGRGHSRPIKVEVVN